MTPTLAPTMTQSLTPAQTSVSLLGITAVSLILAVIIRRRVPRVAASITTRVGALRGAVGGSRSGGRARGPAVPGATGRGHNLDPIGLARAALGWLALALFAVAGVAASGTFIGSVVLWAAHTADTFSRWLIGLFPTGGHTAASLGFSLVAVAALWLGLNLLGDLIEGRAHHGGADLLVFCGPMLFTLVPGVFGQGATWVYANVAAHVGPVVAHLV